MILTRVEKEKSIDSLYDSSNILASSYNTENSDLTITFKRGTQYTYRGVSKRDYTRFELAESQGKVLNTHIKSYSFIKGNDVNTEALINEINAAKPKEMSLEGKVLLRNMQKFIDVHEGQSDIDLTLLEILDVLIVKQLQPDTHE